ADDPVGADKLQPLNNVETDAAEAKDDAIGPRLDACRVDYSADAGGDAATDIAGLVEGGVVADFCNCDLGQHREVRKGRTAHIVEDGLALVGEARRAIRHQALA